ncbi:MAG: hypothetical protein ACK5HT_20250 [Draconibacterium sp.]
MIKFYPVSNNFINSLVQKYYIKLDTPGEFGGVYIWDSPESPQEFRQSELAATIAQTYRAIEAPSVEVVNIMFQLREYTQNK